MRRIASEESSLPDSTQFQFILKRLLFGRKAGAFVLHRLSACCPTGPADPAKPAACLILCIDRRHAALRGLPTRPSLRLAESLQPAILI